MEAIRKMCGYANGIDVCVDGSKEGLYLGRKEEVIVTLKSYSRSHIDIEVMENSGE